jgi:hypothetical protein
MDWTIFSQWFTENFGQLSLTAIITAIITFVTWYLAKKVFPNVMNTGLSVVTKVVAKMFGLPQDDVSAAIKELPIVKQMNTAHAEFIMAQEAKLVEYKNKLLSPKLSDVEKVAYQAMYNKAMAALDNVVSAETQKILDELEALAKNTFSL